MMTHADGISNNMSFQLNPHSVVLNHSLHLLYSALYLLVTTFWLLSFKIQDSI